MTPKEIAQKLAAYYRAHPERWMQEEMGSLQYGCCLLGGAIDLLNDSIPEYNTFRYALARTIEPDQAVIDRRGPSTIVVFFNDKAGQTVENVCAMLDRVP